ncbi:MAG: hypothetical protein LC676_06960 [Loktanella sp.]|nr:hypothetical protein [Loktanella sp.]
MIRKLPQRNNMKLVNAEIPSEEKQMNIEIRTPSLEEVDAILREARAARALMISDFFRRLFHRPEHKPVGAAHTA